MSIPPIPASEASPYIDQPFAPGPYYWGLAYKPNASYQLVLRLDPPAVSNGWWRSNRESKAKLGTNISGFGVMITGKIWMGLPAGLVDPKDPGTQFSTVDFKRGQPLNTVTAGQGKFMPTPLTVFGVSATGIQSFTFDYVIPNLDATPPITGEVHTEKGYPITTEMNISKRAPEGDHDITAVLTYLTPAGWRTTKGVVTIHVNTWVEK
jgi:hypothetical protein